MSRRPRGPRSSRSQRLREFAVAGSEIAVRVLGSAYGDDVGTQIGRLVVAMAPYMVASVALSVTFPLVFVAGRGGRLPLVGLGVLAIHVPLALAGQAIVGLDGLALALAVSTAVAFGWMLTLLHAARSTARRLALAIAVVAGCALVGFVPAGALLGPAGADWVGSRCRQPRSPSFAPWACAPRGTTCGSSHDARRRRRRPGLVPGALLWRRSVGHLLPSLPVRSRIKTLLGRLGRTKAGRTALLAATVGDPRELRFSTARWWPDETRGFEDLAFLFTSSQLNHGIISQELDEAALLYRLARDVDGGAVVEIGRFKGGSTLLLAAALGGRAELWSYDIHASHQATYTGADLDEELRDALRRLSLEERVHLVVGDSRLASPPEGPIELLFVDGDHSYEGVSADWSHWGPSLAIGGQALFHDAIDHGGVGTYVDGVGAS